MFGVEIVQNEPFILLLQYCHSVQVADHWYVDVHLRGYQSQIHGILLNLNTGIFNTKQTNGKDINRKTNNDCKNRFKYYFINNEVYLI